MMQRIETCLICDIYSKVNDAAYGNMSHTQASYKNLGSFLMVSIALANSTKVQFILSATPF